MRVSVVVPTFNGAGRLIRLLETLGPDIDAHQVVVVDNGSTDGTPRSVADRFARIEIVTLERNEGFSRAVNLGARRAEGDALVLLNDDCICDPGFVAELAGALDPGGGTVMAAGVLRRWREPEVIESAGMELDATLLVWEYLHGEPLSVLERPVADPIGPSAAAAAFDRDAFLAAGGFDENLFAYWEDVDLVLRLRLEGGRCALAKTARGAHEHAATLGSGSRAKNYLMGFGRGYLVRKWGVTSARRLPAVFARDVPICMGQALVDGNVAGVRGRIAGYRAAGGASYPYPGGVLAGHAAVGSLTTLGRRARRRVGFGLHAKRAA